MMKTSRVWAILCEVTGEIVFRDIDGSSELKVFTVFFTKMYTCVTFVKTWLQNANSSSRNIFSCIMRWLGALLMFLGIVTSRLLLVFATDDVLKGQRFSSSECAGRGFAKRCPAMLLKPLLKLIKVYHCPRELF
jgi:multidrug transporter EmrE-like cation transporter